MSTDSEDQPKPEKTKAQLFEEWSKEQSDKQLEEAKATAKEEELKVRELEIQKREAELEVRERKDLMGKLGVTDEEEAKKYEEKPLEVLRELVEYRKHIKVSGGGIPKSAAQPVTEEVVQTPDSLQFKQKLRKADGTWVEV